jgi:predicted DNA-binding transcriptional regulator AlpA
MPESHERLIRKKDLLERLGNIHFTTLWAWCQSGQFPLPLVLNSGGGSREIVAWRESEVTAWFSSLPQRMAKPQRKTPYPRGPRAKKLVASPGE